MDAANALPLLSAAEARALGCLIEKEATTPDVYPLTIAAVLSAANQKTAREPLMALETGAVIQVPLFLNEGDVVRVDRREDKYMERAK